MSSVQASRNRTATMTTPPPSSSGGKLPPPSSSSYQQPFTPHHTQAKRSSASPSNGGGAGVGHVRAAGWDDNGPKRSRRGSENYDLQDSGGGDDDGASPDVSIKEESFMNSGGEKDRYRDEWDRDRYAGDGGPSQHGGHLNRDFGGDYGGGEGTSGSSRGGGDYERHAMSSALMGERSLDSLSTIFPRPANSFARSGASG